MPRITDEVLRCVFFLYSTREAAEEGHGSGGTGFLLTHKHSLYGVTNYHVAKSNGFSVARITSVDGSTKIFEFDPSDWHSIPGGADLAAIELPWELVATTDKLIGKFHASAVAWNLLATETEVRHDGIGPGEDVFMVGRFIDHDGGERNMPTVRFGNISAMPAPIKHPNGFTCDCYTIDMHSRSGFSGSPVFAFRTFGQDLTPDATKRMFKRDLDHGTLITYVPVFRLLGVHCGQFSEEWRIRVGTTRPTNETADQYIEGLSGMTIVVPASRVKDLLELPIFAEARERKHKIKMRELYQKSGQSVPLEFQEPSSDTDDSRS